MKMFSRSLIIKMSNTRSHLTFEISHKSLMYLITIYFDIGAYLVNKCDKMF